MALSKDFPSSPHAILNPNQRWRPDSDGHSLPPLVETLRREVKAFRDAGYAQASDTSRALLNWWFDQDHMMEQEDGSLAPFRYYFAQREAVETVIWLFDVAKARTPYNLMRYDRTREVFRKMFDEDWCRYVIKMATGAGKTKVLSLALAWSFFHKTYETDSDLSRNFLVIAPNIIVLDRIRTDFEGLKIFFDDSVLPRNGWEGRNWRDDFQLRFHIQDDVRVTEPTGNIFLTNIHRVYDGSETAPSPEDNDTMDYFLGSKVTGKTTDNQVDLDLIVRDIDELMVLNDEAHHIHDSSLSWFQSIQDIHNHLVQKGDVLSMQLDVTATPTDSGGIFVQTVSDYPLVEAISQNVVKHPLVPDEKSRRKLDEKASSKFTERYGDYLDLGVAEWQAAYSHHEALGKRRFCS
ncbi:MAG: DEAD/DEAH box helicase family protein [Litorimonas sp.]